MDNFETEKISNLLYELFSICSKKKIKFTVNKESEESNIKFDSKHLILNIPDIENNKDLPIILTEWIEKIKSIP
jgi:hypothetical protein